MVKNRQVDMLNGPLFRKMLMFAIPIIITSTLQQLFSSIDVAVIGKFGGSQAMAAVGSNGPIINLIVNLLVGMSIGANVVIANYIGQGKRRRVNATVHTAILVAVIGGALFGAIGIAISGPLITAMGMPDDVLDMAVTYLRLICLGIPLMAVYNFSASILRSKGDTIRPLICLAVSGVIKVGFNLLFVAVLDMSVSGVAFATIIANALSSSLMIWILTHETDEFRLEFNKLKINKYHLSRIISIGLPSGVQGMVFSVSNIFIQASINSFGSDAIAGAAAALNFEYFGYFALNAFVQTTMTFTGQNYGARNMERCRKIFYTGLFMAALATAMVNFGFFFGKVTCVGLFTSVPVVAAWAYIRMRRVLVFQWIASSYEVSSAALRGMGHSTLPALLTVLGTCVVRILWIFTVFRQSGAFEVLMDVYPITWVLTGIAVVTAYYIIRGKEEKKRNG